MNTASAGQVRSPTLTFTEGDLATAVTSAITVSDPDTGYALTARHWSRRFERNGTQLRALREGGTQVTVGGLSLQPIAVGAGPLSFKDLAVQGFWITRWYREAPAAERNRMLAALGRLVDEHRLHQSVAARFPLAQWREALAAAMAPRSGKILLTC